MNKTIVSMKNYKTINILVLIIVILALWTSYVGIFSNEYSKDTSYEIETFRGETVEIHGTGLYTNDSVSVASQGIAQDVITAILGVPLLIISLFFIRKGSLKGKLLLTGTLGYFLYTYISYVFLWMYNKMFIVYVVLMSASFFALVLSFLSIDLSILKESFKPKLPIKFLGGFQIFFAFALGMLWLGKIFPTIANGTVPVGLEHYTTLVIQGLDLGFIVPLALLSGILLIQKKTFGYLLSSVIIMKGFTMGAALSAMIFGQYLAGITMGIVEVIMFPLFSVIILFCLILLMKNIEEKR